MIRTSITSLDFLSIKPELNFSSNTRVKSILGGILSLSLYILTTLGLIIFSQDFREKKGAVVSESTLYNENTLTQLNRDNFFVKFGLFSSDTTSLGKDWESYFNVFVYQFSYNYQYNNATEKNELKLKTREINSTKCTFDYMSHFPTFNKSSYDYFYCLNPDFNATVMNKFASIGENAYLNIFFTICKNETAARYNKTCKSSEEIKQKLSNYVVKFSLGDYFIDHENFEEPFISYLNDQFTSGEISKYNRKIIYLQDQNYTTDAGVILQELDLKKRLLFHSSEFSVSEKAESTKFVPGSFFQISIAYGKLGFHKNSIRRYQKIQNVLANVTGFINAIKQVFVVIMGILSRYTLFNTMILQSSLPFIFHRQDSLNQSELKPIHIDDVRNLVEIVTHSHKKLNFFKPSMKMQFMTSLACFFKNNKRIKLVKQLNLKITESLDVKSFIKMSNTLNDLKTYLFDDQQLRLFEYINKLQGNFVSSQNDDRDTDINIICQEIENHPNETTKKLLNMLIEKTS